MSKKYPEPRKWRPKHPEKYVGDINKIILRSGLEIKFANWCDNQTNIIRYASEEIVIPYLSPDGKIHRYFCDFWIEVKATDNSIKRYLVEIKPDVQTRAPVLTESLQRNRKRYLTEMMTWLVNSAKWDAARKFCEKNGMEFIIITEKHLRA